MAGNARARRAASLGQAPPLVDVGRTRELMPAASSGQGHVRAGRGLPTPCRRGDRPHVSRPRIDSRGWRYRQRQVQQARPCLNQTAVHLARLGACHRPMARVRVPAGWLWDWDGDSPGAVPPEKRAGTADMLTGARNGLTGACHTLTGPVKTITSSAQSRRAKAPGKGLVFSLQRGIDYDMRSLKMSSQPIEVWGKSYPQLRMALRYYDELDSLPDTAWFIASKRSHQGKIGQIIDAVILVLNTSGAGDCRREIRTLQQAITESLTKQAQYREWQISAPPKASQSFFEAFQSMGKTSRESYEQSITAEAHKVTEMREGIARLREQFRAQITQIGVQASDDEIDTLLNPVTQDDIVSMAAVVKNIASADHPASEQV